MKGQREPAYDSRSGINVGRRTFMGTMACAGAGGCVFNANLAQYHVPVNADIADIDITFVDENDTKFNPLGARGIGEIGITGVAAAIANAVYHATGKRVRDLPITPDKLFGA